MYIYKTTNLINNKVYIGQSTKIINKDYFGSGILITRSIQKYGKENFKLDILENDITDIDTLNEREKYWISHYKKILGVDCYNIHPGGNGHFNRIVSSIKKIKISTKLKLLWSDKSSVYNSIEYRTKLKNRPINIRTGHTISSEHKKRISESNKGKIVSEETKRKISFANSGVKNGNYGKTPSNEFKLKMSERHSGGRNAMAVKVVDISTNITYDCIKDIAKIYNVSTTTIRYHCKKGIKFKYLNKSTDINNWAQCIQDPDTLMIYKNCQEASIFYKVTIGTIYTLIRRNKLRYVT